MTPRDTLNPECFNSFSDEYMKLKISKAQAQSKTIKKIQKAYVQQFRGTMLYKVRF